MEIKINNVTYKDIFNRLNLVISNNKVTSIIGKNGSGKTTLLNLICGLCDQFQGHIVVDDQIINTEAAFKKLRNNISYLLQDIDKEMIYSNFFKDFKLNKKINEKYEYLITLLNIKEDILRKSSLEISSSEFKKVLLLKTFIASSNLILLDDPTSNLDQKTQSNLVKIIKREKSEGKTILIASNDVEFLLKISDEIIVLDGNNTSKFNEKYEIFSNGKVLDAINYKMPQIVNFKLIANKSKKIKLMYRDNINDLIKDIYRNA